MLIRPFVKRAAVGLVACVALAASGCNDPDPVTGSDAGTATGDASPSPTGKKGTFTVDGQTKDCVVSTEVFPATKEYSVVCQNDDYGFVQVTFKDEAAARATQTLEVVKGTISSHPDADTIIVEFHPLPGGPGGPVVASKDGAAGTASSANGTVTLTGVVLQEFGGTVTRTVGATISY